MQRTKKKNKKKRKKHEWVIDKCICFFFCFLSLKYEALHKKKKEKRLWMDMYKHNGVTLFGSKFKKNK